MEVCKTTYRAPLNRGAFFFASFLMVETGHGSVRENSNHADVPIGSLKIWFKKQKLWFKRQNFFY
jgi:hypothetical protein